MPATLPPIFIRMPGDIVGAPPYRATGCLMQGLFLKGSRAAQQRLCDSVLNRPGRGEWVFHAMMDHVLVTAIYVDTMASRDAIDAAKGVIQEWDVGFWTAVHGGRVGDEERWSVYWLPSFMFVDTASAMSSGREIYGYPKTVAGFSGRSGNHADASVVLNVLHYPTFGQTARPITGPLVTIAPGGPGVAPPDFISTVKTAWDLLGGIVGGTPMIRDGLHLPPLPTLSMPQILLQQVRDPVLAGRAAVQSIVMVAPKALRVTGGGLLHAPTLVSITPSASHPIAETLGLAASQEAELGFWITQDFEVGLATRLT